MTALLDAPTESSDAVNSSDSLTRLNRAARKASMALGTEPPARAFGELEIVHQERVEAWYEDFTAQYIKSFQN